MRTACLLGALVVVPALAAVAHGMPFCPPQPTHTYVGPLGALAFDNPLPGLNHKAGQVTVTDTSFTDCDGDGVPGDFDGDYDFGIGGGFFGFGPWANEPLCNYGLHAYHHSVLVNDFLWGSRVAFEIGADDMDGPSIWTDPVTGATSCTTDGLIAPTIDADDCLAGIYYSGSGQTCGAGGDGGFWVILDVAVDPGLGVSNPALFGTITAFDVVGPYKPYTGQGFVAVHRA